MISLNSLKHVIRPLFLVVLAALLPVLSPLRIQAAAPESYEKLWRAPAVNARIDRNIERYRKGDADITVVDAAGKPVSGARVEARQTGHEFLFGSNAFVLGQLKTPELNRRYEEVFTHLFNFATVPFYWDGNEPTRGELRYQEAGARDIWRRPPTDRFIPFAKKYGLTLKGHVLVYGAFFPKWLPTNPDEVRALYQKRFREIAGRYGKTIAVWDVVNESQEARRNFPLNTPDLAYVAWAFQQAVPLFPATSMMMINDDTRHQFRPVDKNPYLDQVRGLLAQGVKVKGIGLQWHFFGRKYLDAYLAGITYPDRDPMKILDVYDAFGKLGLPLYITEITIPSEGEGGEALQAEVVRDCYRMWFGTPAMAGITWWNLGDGTAYGGENSAKGGLVDNDLKPKPAYRVLDQLINHEWKTNATLTTDARGQARFRGFYGKYRVKVTEDGKAREFDIDLIEKTPHEYRLTLKD